MGLFGKSGIKREYDAKKLKKCIKYFSNEIEKISKEICEEISSGKENFDEVTYNKFSSAYNESFSDYITNKDKKRFSHTNDVLKGISKKIKKFENKPIFATTYEKYYKCYYYNPSKIKKDAAIADNDVRDKYFEMVETLTEKLKEIIAKSKARLDIKISDNEFDKESKQKELFKKFEEFDNFLESTRLDGKYSQISDEFKKTFSDYINGKGLDKKRKWFSHTNDVFKAIDKKLKKFDKQHIDKETYKEYSECFKYEPKKTNKKAAIDDKKLLKLYQELHEKILIKLGDYLEEVSLKGFKNAINNFEKEVDSNINDIRGCSDFDKYLKEYFSNIHYDQKNGESIYSLFKKFVDFEYSFFDSRTNPTVYTDNISRTKFYSDYSNKKSKLYDELIKLIEAKIQKCVENIEGNLSKEIDLTINSDDINFSELNRVLVKLRPQDVTNIMKWAVMKGLTLKVSKNFSIYASNDDDTFKGTWDIPKTEIAPNLEKIKIEGTKVVILTEVFGNVFEGITNLESIDFENVDIAENISLRKLKDSLGVKSSVVVRIDGKTLEDFIKEEEDKDVEEFKDAINEFKKEVESNINNIHGCNDFNTYLYDNFSNIYYDQKNGESIYSLFKNFVDFKYFFLDSRIKPNFYTKKISPTKFYSNKKSKLYDELINFIAAKIEKHVNDIEGRLSKTVKLTIGSDDINFDELNDTLNESSTIKDASFSIQWAVITDLTLTVSKDFSICTSNNSTFYFSWTGTDKEPAPNLEKIKIEGPLKKVTLTKIGGNLFEGIPNLKSIEFENVKFDESIDLRNLKELLGVGTGVTIKIDGKELNVFIKEEEDKKKNQE